MVLLGYAGMRLLLPSVQPARAPSPAVQIVVPASTGATSPRPDDLRTTPSAVTSAAPSTTALAAEELEPGAALRLLPFVDRSRGIAVGEDEGLLVIEYESSGEAPHVRVLDRELGPAPVAAAVPAGRHQVELAQGKRISFRAVTVRRGATTILDGRPAH
jgi:hypothetical protein